MGQWKVKASETRFTMCQTRDLYLQRLYTDQNIIIELWPAPKLVKAMQETWNINIIFFSISCI